MRKLNIAAMVMSVMCLCAGVALTIHAEESGETKEKVKDVVKQLQNATNKEQKQTLMKKLRGSRPETRDDVESLVNMIKDKNLNYDLLIKKTDEDKEFSEQENEGYAAYDLLTKVDKQNKKLMKTYVSLLEDKNPTVRNAVMHVIKEIKPKEAVPHLVKMMKDFNRLSMTSVINAQNAAQTLADIGDESALPEMIEQVGKLPDVRDAVRKYGDKAIPLLLEKIKKTKDEKMLLELNQAFPIDEESKKKALPLYRQVYEDRSYPESTRAQARDMLCKYEKGFLDNLIKNYEAIDVYEKCVVIGHMAKDKNDLDFVVKVLKSKDSKNDVIRYSAVAALSSFGNQNHISLLEEYLKEWDYSTRARAVEGLKRITGNMEYQKYYRAPKE